MKRNKRKLSKSNGKRRENRRRSSNYDGLTEQAKGAYDRTTAFVTDVRSGKGPKNELLREHHLTWKTAQKYGGRDLLGGGRGNPVRASKSDRRVRDLLFPTPEGDVPIRTRSSRDATKLSDYYNDREKLLRGKMSVGVFESKWKGVRIAGKEVFADSGTILEMADADVLKMENLYASVSSEQ
ncbi:MAG TPA: hypothetical protein VMP68_05710 [Candidatus Eisenbacteria bacterium]|nr:hypothetical protein [Candidatus Eisenbacteria bacterium]